MYVILYAALDSLFTLGALSYAKEEKPAQRNQAGLDLAFAIHDPIAWHLISTRGRQGIPPCVSNYIRDVRYISSLGYPDTCESIIDISLTPLHTHIHIYMQIINIFWSVD